VSIWAARFISLGARFAGGGLIALPTCKDLVRLLPGTPVCMHWEGRELDHPRVGGRITATIEPGAAVGSVLGARLLSDGVYGFLSINGPALECFLLEAEREGRLLEGPGLSVRGRVELIPRPEGEPVGCFADLIALDIVHGAIGGGCLLQSSVAEAAGLACPVPPKFTPLPRPASPPAPRPVRERSGAGSIRYERTGPRVPGPIATEFHMIPPGGDY